jgi:hypothetical protein
LSPSVTVPVPCPPVAALHWFQLMSVTVAVCVVHPMMSFEGFTICFDPGPHVSTDGTADVVVVPEDVDVVDPTAELFFDDWGVGGEEPEPAVSPMAMPAPRAASTSTATPTLTSVLRRTVMTEEFSATTGNGSRATRGGDKSTKRAWRTEVETLLW